MSVDLSKTGFGVVVAHAPTDGVIVSKVGYGIIVDNTPPPPRRRRTFMP